MKKSLFALVFVAAVSAQAQTPRLSLYEEFTGETCPPCAATNPGLNAILLSATNATKIVAIKWQVPIPSAPTNTWSLYQTNKAEIDWRYRSTGAGGYGYPSQNTPTNAITSGINSAPSGRIDGQHQWAFGATSDHPFYINNNVIATAQSYTSAFSVTMNRAWDQTYSSVDLTVTIVASANFNAVGNLIFRTVMVEREIEFATQPGTNGEKFFEDVAVRSFPTLQGGVPMASSWTVGQTQTFTLNCPLPSYIRDKGQVAFVGFIQDDGDRRVAQAVRADVDPLPNDAKAVTALVPVVTCSNAFVPQVTVKNNGSTAITNLTITPYVNGVAAPDFIWTGNLAIGASTTMPLNALNVSGGTNTFSYNISGVSGTDNNLTNNTAKKSFIVVSSFQGTPVSEGFVQTQFPPANWALNNPSGGATWFRTATAGGFGLSASSAKLDLYSTVAAGSTHELFLPPMTLTAGSAPSLSFDVAYCQYSNETDQLDVKVSDDCGQTWTTVYSKNGAGLATAPVKTSAFTPAAGEWRTEVVSLSSFTTGDILVKFVGISDYGNNLYIDNVNLSQCMTQSVTATTPKNVICKGEVITLTAGGANSYTWSNNQSAASFTVAPSSTSTFVVTSADPNSCKNSASIVVTVNACQGIATAEMLIGAVSIYPNPAAQSTNLSVELSDNESIGVEVMNSVGQLVYSSKQEMSAGINTVSLNTQNWANGVYFVKVSSGKGTVNSKFTVAR